MLNSRFAALNHYPFRRLADLIAGPGPATNEPPVDFSVGEPRHKPPAFLHEIVTRSGEDWNRYPPLNGTPELRAACAAWLTRRYKLPAGMIDPETQIAPVAGTREGLFSAALIAISPAAGEAPPLALMPNPFYQVYYGAATCAGAEACFLPATKATGYLPDLDALDEASLRRAQIFYLCSPANPQGAVAGLGYLKRAIQLARRHDFLLVVDECYAEIYNGPAPPVGALEAAAALGGGCDNLLVFHTLSKRSSAPGLRSGFAAGSPQAIAALMKLRSYNCAATPFAAMAAATALWQDEAHVAELRAQYRAAFAAAERRLAGRFGFYKPEGGFYLWLDVGDGEDATKRLWREAGVKVLPGAYLTHPDADGRNAGKPYIRVALVYDLATTEAALARMARVL
ncbi:MAG: aminotransferase class I/II-fold pyridoxal phosphate-dependent enzyme [Alphaproteobacteria bacterium]|nr:aminotransferase class I/II-fold pyridoxal phosphate-dependent enzyme [Alphaproteobacteria bacterium]